MRFAKKSIITTMSVIIYLFVGPMHVVRHLWEGLFSKQPQDIGFSFIKEAYATVLASVADALNSFLPDAQSIDEDVRVLTAAQKEAISARGEVNFDPDFSDEFHFYIGKVDGQIIGYAVDDYVKGKWGLIHYMVHLDPKGMIQSVMVLEYGEKRGKPVAKRRFLKQFKGKSINDRIKLKKDIKGVTGASISSSGMTNGVRKIVHVFNELYIASE